MIFIILKVILIILLLCLFILGSFMLMPFEYKGYAHIKDAITFRVNFKILLGLMKFSVVKADENSKVNMKIRLCGININLKKFKTHKDKNVKKKKEKKNNNITFSSRLINIGYNYFKDIIKIIKPKYFKANGIYAFDDPYITGVLCGFINVINGIVPSANINLNPSFEEDECNIELECYGRVFCILILLKTLRLLLKKDVRKIIFKKKEKNETFSKELVY